MKLAQFVLPATGLRRLSVAVLLILMSSPHAHAVTSLTWLGKFPLDSSSYANDISGDGLVVVGASYQDGSSSTDPIHGFRWTLAGGMVSIGDLAGGLNQSTPMGVSGNGSVIVGASSSALSSSGGSTYAEPFRWNSSTGMQGLGYLSNYAQSYGGATGVSTDGSVVVGISVDANGNERPFRWTQAGGMVNLGTLTNYAVSNQNVATDVSGNGAIVVGMSLTETGRNAFRWTSGTGMQPLGNLPGAGGGGGSELYSYAQAISADGSTIVGTADSASGLQAFRWTSGGGMVGLGDLPGSIFSSDAYDVSANGQIIVGDGYGPNGREAVRWDPITGLNTIRSLLVANGVSVGPGLSFDAASAVSDDGQTIVGYGVGPGGYIQGWVATISLVPEPSSAVLLAIGVAGFAAKRRRRS